MKRFTVKSSLDRNVELHIEAYTPEAALKTAVATTGIAACFLFVMPDAVEVKKRVGGHDFKIGDYVLYAYYKPENFNKHRPISEIVEAQITDVFDDYFVCIDSRGNEYQPKWSNYHILGDEEAFFKTEKGTGIGGILAETWLNHVKKQEKLIS